MTPSAAQIDYAHENKVLTTCYTIGYVVDTLSGHYKLAEKAVLKSYETEQIGIQQGFLSTIVKIRLHWAAGSDARLPSVVVMKVPTIATMTEMLEKNEAMAELAKEFASES